MWGKVFVYRQLRGYGRKAEIIRSGLQLCIGLTLALHERTFRGDWSSISLHRSVYVPYWGL